MKTDQALQDYLDSYEAKHGGAFVRRERKEGEPSAYCEQCNGLLRKYGKNPLIYSCECY